MTVTEKAAYIKGLMEGLELDQSSKEVKVIQAMADLPVSYTHLDVYKRQPWSSASIRGCQRFLERYWNLQGILNEENGLRPALESSFHKAIKKVGEDIENLKFNTAIASLMALINEIYDSGSVTRDELKIFTILLNPFAPHLSLIHIWMKGYRNYWNFIFQRLNRNWG